MDDTELIDALRTSMLAADPAPAGLRAKALRAQTWDTDDSIRVDVMVLADDPVLAGMRGDEGPQDFRAQAGGFAIELTIDPRGDLFEVYGSIRPRVASVTVHPIQGEDISVECDADGRFSFTHDDMRIALSFADAAGNIIRTSLLG